MANFRPESSADRLENADAETVYSALFEDFVIQQAHTATLFLGKNIEQLPDQEQVAPDIESAKRVIDQLEMIEQKTKGNLTAKETDFLERVLNVLRHDFAEVLQDQTSS